MMPRSIPLAAFIVLVAPLAFASVACSQGASDESDTAEGAVEQAGVARANAHLAAVGRCDKVYARASNRAVSTADMIQASAAYGDCVKRANDAVVSRVEANLREAQSSYVGGTTASIAAFRAAGEALCVEADKASPNFGGTLSRVEATACRSSREAFLAALIDDNASLGDEAGALKEDRSHHRSCYRNFDKRLDQAVANNEMVQATYGLAECVTRRAGLLATPIGRVQVGNDAAAGPEAAAVDRVRKATEALISKGGELCALLNEAGDNGTGTLSRVTSGTCQARVAESVFTSLRALLDEG